MRFFFDVTCLSVLQTTFCVVSSDALTALTVDALTALTAERAVFARAGLPLQTPLFYHMPLHWCIFVRGTFPVGRTS